MAINYQRVNWTTSKFVNPTNMNQMDAGIKAACDGVDSMAYKSGDSMPIGLEVFVGLIAANKKSITFTIWTPKSSVGLTPSLSGNIYARDTNGAFLNGVNVNTLSISIRAQRQNCISFSISNTDESAFPTEDAICTVVFNSTSNDKVTFA